MRHCGSNAPHAQSAGKNKDRRKKLADRLDELLGRLPETEQAAQLRSMIDHLRSNP